MKICLAIAFGTSCKAEPTEYSYEDTSVIRTIGEENNCIRYDPTDNDGDQVDATRYVHCHGNKVLTDSNVGSSQYDSSRTPLYVWTSSTSQRILFVFPATTTFTMITLHYYSGNYQGSHKAGLPRLLFYAVTDNFDAWDAVAGSSFRVEVSAVSPREEQPAGRTSVSINFNSSTKKVLMVKTRSDFHLAVSEVEFFICPSKCGYISISFIPQHSKKINPIATVATEPQSSDGLTSTNPAMITTFATSEVSVPTTGSTFTTSEVSSTYRYNNVSQDPDSANNTVTGLPGKSYTAMHVILNN